MIEKLKSLASQTAIYGLFTVIGRLLTFLLTPLYTHYLTNTEMVDVIFLFSMIAFIDILYSFGMESAYFRFYKKNDEHQSKKAFSLAWFSIFFVSLIFTALWVFTAKYTASSLLDSPNPIMLLTIAMIIPLTDTMHLIPYAYLRMTNRAKVFSSLKFAMILLVVGLNYVLVARMGMGLEGVLYAQLITNIVGVIIFLGYVGRNLILNFDFSLLKEMLIVGLPTLPANLSAMALQLADRPIFKLFPKVENQLAVYGVNYRLGIPMMIFVTVFEYAWKPYYLNNYESPDAKKLFSRVFTYFTVIGSVVFLSVSLGMDYVIRIPITEGKTFIEQSYWSGSDIIPIILAAYFFNGAFTNFSAGFLITKKTKYLPIAVGSAAVINIGINLLFLPIYGFRVAAWSTLIAYFISAVIIYYYSRKVYPIDYEWKRVFIVIFTTIIVFAATFIIKLDFGLLDVIFKFCLVILYVVLLRLMGFFTPGEINRLKSIVKRKSQIKN